jgi:hypothetical protein
MNHTILYRGVAYSSANFVRLLRIAMDKGPVYITFNRRRYRVFSARLDCDGNAILDAALLIRYQGEPLDNGRDSIAF